MNLLCPLHLPPVWTAEPHVGTSDQALVLCPPLSGSLSQLWKIGAVPFPTEWGSRGKDYVPPVLGDSHWAELCTPHSIGYPLDKAMSPSLDLGLPKTGHIPPPANWISLRVCVLSPHQGPGADSSIL